MLSGFRKRLSAAIHRPKDAAQAAANQVPKPGEAVQQVLQPQDTQVTATSGHLTVNLKNDSHAGAIYAYVTGQAIDSGNKLFLLKSDGKTAYFPSSPSKTQSALQADCAIKLGSYGQTRSVTIPRIAGGRIWVSYDKPLVFHLNPGPALVEPSVTNPSDPNYSHTWDFCEFTYNSAQLFANITYVDFVSIPIALTLETASGTKHVSGMKSDGLTNVASALRAQEKADGKAWSKLIVPGPNNQPLRVLSPNAGHVISGDIFRDYYAAYVDRVWAKYSSADLSVNTQAQWGVLAGRVRGGSLVFSDGSAFAKPSAADIFSCSTGPFTGSSPSKLALIPRVAAAFNRSTLLAEERQPDGGDHRGFYREGVTNHYARVVHRFNVDGRGYAFPYDDVVASDGFENAGTVFDARPRAFTVVVGGRNAHA